MKTQDTLQVIIFRKVQTDYEFLLLKRIPEKGGFWQPISARIEKDVPNCYPVVVTYRKVYKEN